jgi:hypothetical protein
VGEGPARWRREGPAEGCTRALPVRTVAVAVPVRIHRMGMWRREYFLPFVLILLGIYFLLRNVHLLDQLHADIVWPVLLILFGGWLIVRRART